MKAKIEHNMRGLPVIVVNAETPEEIKHLDEMNKATKFAMGSTTTLVGTEWQTLAVVFVPVDLN